MNGKRDASSAGLDKQRQKKYHRRAAWACDECRLRKIKCDGNEPCKHCVDTNHECSYEGRTRPPLPPTKRIRILEETLRHVRSSLLAHQEAGNRSFTPDQLDALLERMDPSNLGGDEDGNSQPASHAPDDRLRRERPAPRNQERPEDPTESEEPAEETFVAPTFFGPTSGHSIICRISKTFQEGARPDDRVHHLQWVATDLYCPSRATHRKYEGNEQTTALPSVEDLRDLYKRCFEEHLLLFQALAEPELERVLRKFDKGSKISNPDAALLHGVAALGYARGRKRHAELGCESSLDVAAQHFRAAERKLRIARCEDVTSLQAVLCMVVYLISISDIASAHTFSCMSCAWILQLGLHRNAKTQVSKVSLPGHRSKDLLIVTMKLHLQLTSTLDLPQALQRRQIDSEIWASVQSRYDSHLATELDRASPSSCHFLLLEVTKEGLDKTFTQTKDNKDMSVSTDEEKDHVDLSQLGSVEARLQELIERASSSTSKISNPAMAAAAKSELEMTIYSCQLMLYMPFMHHVENMAKGNTTSRTRTQRVLTCIKVASKTIAFCESQMNHKMLEPSSWFQTYTLFLAVLTLVFLIASHKGTTQPSEAWKKAEQGIRILASMRCHDNGAQKCLRVLRALVNQLSHTVEFDLDAIERSTPLLCEGHSGRSSAAASGATAVASPSSRDIRMMVSNVMQPPDSRDRSAADRMLAEANDFVLFGNNDGFGVS